ncbi:hypothetical protein B5G11_12625 [Drancourtella sp. An57]|uniref:glycosyltransferase n=1 Tax=Drancourtella sp. An57 TaxID=1965647 RepID=UPI000B38BEBB|nr:glycosyltransferase [Drancourtella sp. An57]OUN68404.1 hypothetical protein B5G11_12625 [Drancourtella sp. An57]
MSQRVRVLMVVKGFEIQGISKVVLDYVEHIDRQKFQVDVVSGDNFAKSNVIQLKATGGKLWCIPDRDKNIFVYILKLARIVKSGSYKIVHAHGNSAMIIPELIAAELGGAKVRIAHSHNVTCNHPLLHKALHPIFSALYTHALACSEEAGLWMFKGKKFTVIKNGIETLKYAFDLNERIRVRHELGLTDEILIGHVGNFNYQKNQERLVNILKNIIVRKPRTKVLFVGTGEEQRRIATLARDLGLSEHCIFYGVSGQIEKLMSAMDIFVFPSHYEGFGIVLIEAQASGMICIASTNVPEEANITGAIKYIPLDADDGKWSNIIVESCQYGTIYKERKRMSVQQCDLIRQSGYDISDVVNKLEVFYSHCLKTKI